MLFQIVQVLFQAGVDLRETITRYERIATNDTMFLRTADDLVQSASRLGSCDVLVTKQHRGLHHTGIELDRESNSFTVHDHGFVPPLKREQFYQDSVRPCDKTRSLKHTQPRK